MLYRILTEKTKINLTPILEKYYDGYTVLNAKGYWKGVPEKSIVIEIVTHGNEDTNIRNLAVDIRNANKQECVLVQRIKNVQWFI